MLNRLLPHGLVLVLVVAACSGSAQTTTTTTAPPAVTVPEVEQPEAVALSYALEAGEEYRYEVTLDQNLTVNATGDPELMGGEEVPGEAELNLSGTAIVTQVVAEGPEPGTFQVTITGDFSDLSVTGTIDGEPVSSEEIPEFAEIEPVDVTVIVDEHGNLVEGEEAIEDPFGFLGETGPFGGAGLVPGADPGRFIGPPLSEDEVTVGDSWTEQIETPGFGDGPIVTDMASTVTAVDEMDGVEVFVIETRGTTSAIEIDLAEFFVGFFGAFAPEGADEEEAAEFQALMEQLVFVIRVDDSVSEATTWFDIEAGLARRSETKVTTSISMEMTLPDETTGELVGMSMDMSIDQSVGYRLVSAPDA